jgi:cell division protein FtsL
MDPIKTPCEHTEYTWTADVFFMIGVILVILMVRHLFSWYIGVLDLRDDIHELKEKVGQFHKSHVNT